MNTALRRKMKRRFSQATVLAAKYVLLIGLSFIILLPLYTKFIIVLMEQADLNDSTVRYIPKHFTLDNLQMALNYLDYGRSLLLTVGYVLLNSTLQVASCSLTAYGLARYDFPLKKALLAFAILTLLTPPQIYATPLYFHFQNFNFFGLLGDNGINFIGSLVPTVLLSATAMSLKNGLFIYLLRQYFRGVPKELHEAGQIDGAGHFRIFYSIILPGAVPMLITCALFSIVWQWTDVFYSNIFIPENSLLQTQVGGLGQALMMLESQQTGESNYYFASIMNNAAILLFIIPLLILYGFTQRYFVESIERSGLVG